MQPTAARSRGVGQPFVVESLIDLLLSRVAASTAHGTADRRYGFGAAERRAGCARQSHWAIWPRSVLMIRVATHAPR
jgi:hypothetical protein